MTVTVSQRKCSNSLECSRWNNLGEMELKWIICAQTNVKTSLEEIRKRISLVRQEEGVVTQGTHGNANLSEIVQILQCRHLA